MRIWAARALIGLVLFFNLQCAMLFLVSPDLYASGFELSGISGDAVVRGMGLLFLMWNVPYLVALSHPARRRISLWEATAMQWIGFTGEILLLIGLPAGHETLRTTALRFIIFDGGGLLALFGALWVSRVTPGPVD